MKISNNNDTINTQYRDNKEKLVLYSDPAEDQTQDFRDSDIMKIGMQTTRPRR